MTKIVYAGAAGKEIERGGRQSKIKRGEGSLG